jgi:RNA recognition motif-containing protein
MCVCYFLAIVDESGDESDTPSVTESSAGDKNQKEENAIFIRNLPVPVKFNDIFDVFKNFGRIKVCLLLTYERLFVLFSFCTHYVICSLV